MLHMRWSRFIQELPSITFVATINLWWFFHFPRSVSLSSSWSIAYTIGACFFCVFMAVYLFAAMDTLAARLRLDFIENVFFISAIASKKMTRIIQLAVWGSGYFFIWYNNRYNLSNGQYALFFITSLLSIFLVYRAAHKPVSLIKS